MSLWESWRWELTRTDAGGARPRRQPPKTMISSGLSRIRHDDRILRRSLPFGAVETSVHTFVAAHNLVGRISDILKKIV